MSNEGNNKMKCTMGTCPLRWVLCSMHFLHLEGLGCGNGRKCAFLS
jgi:hypothetical protein